MTEKTRKITALDRMLLLITGLLAGYQIAYGINDLEIIPTVGYMVAFGVILVAGLLLIILGFSILDSPLIVIVSTLIPLGLSAGLVGEFYPVWINAYLGFAVVGFLAVVIFRFWGAKSLQIGSLIFVHGVAGLVIFLLPLTLAFSGKTPGSFSLVGVGGALIGIGGLLLSFLKSGKPILSKNTIMMVLPALLMTMMVSFVVGFLNRGF
ncbi:hypothetical protein KQH40_00355 [bacterium]|nr:hypothetical protein [bacterium]